jgi:DNA sulfur modification protein DndB
VNLYPAMKAHMGSWEYFIVKMSMRELSESVKFAHDIHNEKTLDEAIQRVLKESRYRKDMAGYLANQEDRFFSSIIVAALHGNPKWIPVSISDENELLAGDERMDGAFGVLRFDGTQAYYALDGQHRLAAINFLLNPEFEEAREFTPPDGFADEEVSVVVVKPKPEEPINDFMKRYRRLFGNLNRHAKPTDAITNIIMDEDDAFAILTRRLITDHDFFMAPGDQKASPRIKTKAPKTLKEGDPWFTSLETLYAMNIDLLWNLSRRNSDQGWCGEGGEGMQTPKPAEFERLRPSDDCLESLYNELVMYWDGILGEMPQLHEEPSKMRIHPNEDNENADEDSQGESSEDCLLFWPIGQEMLARLVRSRLDRVLPDPSDPTANQVASALEGFGSAHWAMDLPPWKYLLLVPNEGKDGWRVRSEDRKKAVEAGARVQGWVLGDLETATPEVDIRQPWQELLSSGPSGLSTSEIESMWNEIEETRDRLKQVVP